MGPRRSGNGATFLAPEPRGAAPSTSKITMSPTRECRLQARASCDCLMVFIERKQLAEKPHGPGEPSTKEPQESVLASTCRPPTAKLSPMMLHSTAKRRQSHSRHKIVKFVRRCP